MSTSENRSNRFPEWLKVKAPKHGAYEEMAGFLQSLGLHTVCQSASCPNIGECFSKGTATFMILGDRCTRNCGFCGVHSDKPMPVDPDEPGRVAEAAARMGLKYVVVTSVTRDDLPDGGAEQFAKTIQGIVTKVPSAKVEVLIPDLNGDWGALQTILDAEPFVLNHNIETVPRLYDTVRSSANYDRSLRLIETAKQLKPSTYTKSGLMLGLGETKDEVVQTLRDLRAHRCDIITIGQYLRPSKVNLPVVEYVHPDMFDEYKIVAEGLGFSFVSSGPFVRSSYHADEAATQEH